MTLSEFLDNREELATGFLFGLAQVFIAGWLAVAIAVPCAVLWRLGGVKGGNRWFRRLGVPCVIAGALFLATHSLWCLVPFAAMWGPLSLGYGIPDPPDEGSKLGAFFFKLTKKNEKLANILTRGTIALLCVLTLAPLAMVNFFGALMVGIFIVVGWPLIAILI